MAGVKISDLPAIGTAQLTDLVAAVQAGTTYKESITDIMNVIAANINIAESQVTGLTAALDGKVNVAGDTMTGALNLAGLPTTPAMAASKQYVDAMVSAAGISSINVRRIVSTGTYTPTAGLVYATVEIIGGGGGGAGSSATTPTSYAAAAGGGGGAYAKKTFSAATLGVSQTVTIGAGGAGGVGPAAGGNGGTSSFGTLLVVTGGALGGASGASATSFFTMGGAGGTVATLGDVNIAGEEGTKGAGIPPYGYVSGGGGGSSQLGRGAPSVQLTSAGNTALANSGGGGSGSSSLQGGPQINGGNGGSGVCIVTEYIG